MKKTIVICLVGLFIISGLGAFAQSVGTTTRDTVTVSFSQPTLQNANAYLTVSLSEANEWLMRESKPMLPFYTRTFTYPFGTTVTSVTVTPQDIHQESLSGVLEPTPAMVGMDVNQPVTMTSINYGTDLYPATWSNYRVGCGLYNGERRVIVSVDIYPIQYDPLQNAFKYAQQATIVIAYQEPSTPPQASPRDTYSLVVIGPDVFSSQIAPLITHKTSMGVTARFVSLTDISSGTYFPVTGRDTQEKIKYFIKNAIENWNTMDVLLVGGDSQLPARETHVAISDDDQYGHQIFVSDLYYADIYNKTSQFCSWDSNNNNIFGEYNWYGMTDSVDLHPDVYLARIPATSGTQVNTVVNKIITYENNPGYQQSWFPNLVLCGGDSFEDNGDINEGEYANQKVADLMTGFNPIDLWVSNGALTGYTPTGSANIKSTINDGCGFVDFHGHGAPDIWATHPHTDFNHWVPTPLQGFWVSDVSSLSNGDMLPIVTVEACDTAEFDTSDSTFNFQFLADTNGGAIAAFGATGIGYSYTGTGDVQGLIGLMGIDTYKGYKTDGANTFGEMWYHALQRYIKASMEDADYKTVEEWEPFGDPTLVIQEPSNPPAKPATPSGPPSGVAGNSYIYTSSTTDPDNDQVYLMFSWGDNTTSGWVGPYNSGATGSATHTWSKQGSYSIKVMAKDTHGKTSDWSDPLPVQMPLTNSYQGNHPLLVFLQWLAIRFPHIFQLLHSLLG